MIESKIYGVKELQDMLNQMDKVSMRVVTTSAKAGARIVLNYAKSKCPVSPHGKTGLYPHAAGNLKRSIKMWSQKKKSKGKRVYIVGPTADAAWYANFVEYGFFATGRKTLSRNKNIKATQTQSMTYVPGKRIFRDAVDTNRGKIEQTVLNTLGAGLDEAIKGGGIK